MISRPGKFKFFLLSPRKMKSFSKIYIKHFISIQFSTIWQKFSLITRSQKSPGISYSYWKVYKPCMTCILPYVLCSTSYLPTHYPEMIGLSNSTRTLLGRQWVLLLRFCMFQFFSIKTLNALDELVMAFLCLYRCNTYGKHHITTSCCPSCGFITTSNI